MSLRRECDRCNARADVLDVDDLPEGWWLCRVGVKGTADHHCRNGEARDVELCESCWDDLYAWFYDRPRDTEETK